MKKIVFILLIVTIISSCKDSSTNSDAYGNFEAIETMVSAEATGKLEFFNVEEGNIIDSGAVIGCVDTIQLYLKKEQLKAQIAIVNSKSDNVLSQIDVQKEQINTLLVEKQRFEQLIKDNAAPTKNLDDIKGKISLIESQIKSIETQNKPIIAEAYTIEKQIEQIKDQIKKSIIVNPKKGTVIEKYAEPYEIAVAGKSLYKIADLSEIYLRVFLSEKQLSEIKLGDKVKVLTDTKTDKMKEVEGIISWISAQAEFTPKIIQTKEERVNLVYAVKVKVKNDGIYRIGMPAEIKW
ncbi:MAG: HlyD family efflux transporter periplasmic adaptor subunit [Bacteroidota bacterium]